MSSVVYSLHFTPLRKQSSDPCSSCLLPRNIDKVGYRPTNAISAKHNNLDNGSNVTSNENQNLLRRRDVIGTAVSGGMLMLASRLLLPTQSIAAVDGASCEFIVSPSGLAFCDQVVGTGPQAVQGQLIKAHYVGRLENEKVFDSSYNRGKPLTFRIGVGEASLN